MVLTSYRDGTTPPIPVGFPWPRPPKARSPVPWPMTGNLGQPRMGGADFSPPCPSEKYGFVGRIGHPRYMEKCTWCSKAPARLNRLTHKTPCLEPLPPTETSAKLMYHEIEPWNLVSQTNINRSSTIHPKRFLPGPTSSSAISMWPLSHFVPFLWSLWLNIYVTPPRRLSHKCGTVSPFAFWLLFFGIYSGVEQTKITAKRNKHLVPKSARNTWDFQIFLRSGQAARTTKEMWTSAVELWVP